MMKIGRTRSMNHLVRIVGLAVVLCACGQSTNDSQDAAVSDARDGSATQDAGTEGDAGFADASPDSTDAGVALEAGLHTDVSFPVTGGTRNAHVFVPPSEGAAPLIVLLHGNGGSADAMIGEGVRVAPFSEWLSIAEEEGLALLIPDGRTPDGSTSQGWNDCRGDAMGNPESNDASDVAQMVEALVAWGHARFDTVLATGHSNGRHFAFRLALERPELLRGIAVVAASLPTDETNECIDEGVAMPLLVLNGDEDPILPFGGGSMASGRGQVIGFDALVARWVARNGLRGAPAVQTLDRSIPGELVATRIEVADYTSVGVSPVSAMRVVRGGHGEPSIVHEYGTAFESIIGKQSHDAEMTRLVWAFFEGLL